MYYKVNFSPCKKEGINQHSSKENLKISNFARVGGEMLKNTENIALQSLTQTDKNSRHINCTYKSIFMANALVFLALFYGKFCFIEKYSD